VIEGILRKVGVGEVSIHGEKDTSIENEDRHKKPVCCEHANLENFKFSL